MCYLARHQQTPAAETTEPTGSPPSRALRPRWAAAAAAAILAGVAAASLLDRPAPQAASTQPSAGTTAPLATTLVPVTSSAERSPIAPDDGVPTSSSEASRASLGGCHHGA